jgi:hypothetical protein
MTQPAQPWAADGCGSKAVRNIPNKTTEMKCISGRDYFHSLPDFPEKEKGKQVVGLERGPLSLMSTTEELLDRKVAAPV